MIIQKSDSLIVAVKPVKAGGAKECYGSELPKWKHASHMEVNMSMETEMTEIRRQSRMYPTVQCLMNHVNMDTLITMHDRQPANKALGADGVGKEEYGKHLWTNVEGLLNRMKTFSYRPQPVRRAYIPKSNGKLRPLGIPAYEDRLVQGVMAGILNAVYEERFLDCSYGFREGRSAHDVVKVINDTVMFGKVGWVLEADIRSFFDNIDHDWLITFLEHDIKDKNFIRYIKRFLIAGVVEDSVFVESDKGASQGGQISPCCANVYLHYVLDLWYEKAVKPKLRGFSRYVRYADDFLIMFQYRDDAERVLRAVKDRMERFSLELAEEKTRILPFGRFSGSKETFDFLGFTFYNTTSRQGKYRIGIKSSSKKLKQKRQDIKEWLKFRMHMPVDETMSLLNLKLQGHCNYYAISGNFHSVWLFYYFVKCRLKRVLNRRSQKDKTSWKKINRLWEIYITPPSIKKNIWTYVKV